MCDITVKRNNGNSAKTPFLFAFICYLWLLVNGPCHGTVKNLSSVLFYVLVLCVLFVFLHFAFSLVERLNPLWSYF